jgi:hypothetical protein
LRILAVRSLDEESMGSHYATLEVLSGPASGIWICGVILYALVSGKLPFDDGFL